MNTYLRAGRIHPIKKLIIYDDRNMYKSNNTTFIFGP